jgi:predicted Rossmann fold nucleotide-binding protein DprA/Smf involved in DNA uptake
MSIDKVQQEQAILLLTVFFNKTEVKLEKPLSPTEYSRFASWLYEQKKKPADLLSDADTILSAWHDPKQKITIDRLKRLLARGGSMAFAIESWQKHGVWIISRASSEYPPSIRKHLGDLRPPILFGIGNKDLLNRSGIGFVGSRNVEDTDVAYTQRLACQAVDQGFAVISGAAKGVDQAAMEAALQHGGISVGVVSDSLLKASTSRAYREAIQEGRLVLISPYYPEAGFSTGNAMGRNKYIYTLSQTVVVVKSDHDEGGTWAGAIENLKKNWVPLLVRQSVHRGNQELIKKGATPINDSVSDFSSVSVMQSTAPRFASDQQTLSIPSNRDLFADSSELSTSDAHIQAAQPQLTLLNTSRAFEAAAALDQDEVQQAPLFIDGELSFEPVANSVAEAAFPDSSEPVVTHVSAVAGSVEPPAQHAVEQPETTSTQRSDHGLQGTPLEQYGAVFGAFFGVLVDTVQAAGCATPTDLQNKLPELPASVIKKWLTELEQYQLIERKSRKLSYRLLNIDLLS